MTSVLVLTNMYPPHHLGGYELSCRDVMDRLAARGHRVTVLTSDVRRQRVVEDDTADDAGVSVRRELAIYWRDHRLVSPPLWRRLAIERANQRVLASALDASRPNVVSVWNMGAMSLGLLTTLASRHVPMVLSVGNDWLVEGVALDAWTRLARRAPRLARRLGAPAGPIDATITGETATLFVSRWLQARAEHHLGHVVERAAVVGSGIDRRDFPPVAPAPRPWRGRLLFVGRLDPRKGVDTMLRVLARRPDVTLDIVGPGSAEERAHVTALAAQLAVTGRVRVDELGRDRLAARYRDADAVVFPSEWDEPFGLVPLEAMACATPVIASGTGGSAEFLVDRDNALLAAPGDVDAWCQAVDRLATDAELRTRLVHRGLATAAEFDVERLADTFEEWHAAVSSRSSGHARER